MLFEQRKQEWLLREDASNNLICAIVFSNSFFSSFMGISISYRLLSESEWIKSFLTGKPDSSKQHICA